MRYTNKKNIHSTIVLFISLIVALWQPIIYAKSSLIDFRMGEYNDKTRVVLDIKQTGKFEITRMENPPRIVVDLYKTINNTQFAAQTFNNKFLKRIRIQEQYSKNRIRIVLDLKNNYQQRYFALSKNKQGNDRLVIDVLNKTHKTIKRLKKVLKKKKLKYLAKKKKPKYLAKKKKVRNNSVNFRTRSLLQELTRAPLDKKKVLVVAIDAGHGGKDYGAKGAKRGVFEKDVNLKIAKTLKKQIDSQPNMRAILTRKSDKFLFLPERVKIAHKNKADIFISIHADSYPSNKITGGSVYILSEQGRSTNVAKILAKNANASLRKLNSKKSKYLEHVFKSMAMKANIRASRKLASSVLTEMKKNVKIHKHRVQSGNFIVLKSIDMPSMLIETAFITNPIEAKKLINTRFQVKLSKSIVKGLKRFVDAKAVKPSWGETLYVHYRVKAGDTLSKIASNYQVPTNKLKLINSLKDSNSIFIGKRLKLPVTARMVAEL